MRLNRVLSWLELILLWLLIILVLSLVLVVSGVLAAGVDDTKPVAAHDRPAEGCSRYLAEVVIPRESGGDPLAVNIRDTETHKGTDGSYGLYQIAPFLWDEEAERQGGEWVGWYPHWAPAEVQDAIALGICERFGRCPWLLDVDERRRCWQHLA